MQENNMPKTTFFNLDKEKQDTILKAAKREFNLKGYEKATVVNICEKADIKRVNFYTYFESLDDIHDFIFENESNKCNIIFKNQNIIDGFKNDKMNMEDFFKFEKYYIALFPRRTD